MSAATRSVILLVITVIAASLGLPASAEDMSFDYRRYCREMMLTGKADVSSLR